MNKTVIKTNAAPAAIGPYSQAVNAGGIVFISGQLPIVPSLGTLAEGGVEEQTRQSLENIRAIIQEAGGSMANIVKTTCLLQDIGDFAIMNKVYGEFFTGKYPARAAFQVAALPKGALVEIEAVANI